MSRLTIEIMDARGIQSKFWHIVQDVDDVKARSETMYNKSDAVTTATHLRDNPDAYSWDVIDYSDPVYPFTWHVMRNGRIVINSTEKYRTRAAAWRAKDYIRANVRSARIVDRTANASSRW